MKKINKGLCPAELSAFSKNNPNGTWDDFCKDSTDKRIVQQKIRSDQHGLCAYCEIDLLENPADMRDTSGCGVKSDFRIDHFHPKSDKSNPAKNYALDWQNLLGTCTGGDERKVIDSRRFARRKTDRHCDSRKKNHNLDGVILNPLTDIPAFPCLWKCEQDSINHCSTLSPDENVCQSLGNNTLQKANATLRLLNLNCTLLAQFRWETLHAIEEEIKRLIDSGVDPDEAIEKIMEQIFDDTSPNWPSFFSTIRAYFGIAAENRLHTIGYEG